MKFSGDGNERVKVLEKELSQTEKKLLELQNKYYQELRDVAVKKQILLELQELKQSMSERDDGSNQVDVHFQTLTKDALAETKGSVMELEPETRYIGKLKGDDSEKPTNSDQPPSNDPMKSELIEHTFNASESTQPSGIEVLNDPMEAVPARKSEYLKSELIKLVQEILDEGLPSAARQDLPKLSDVQTCSGNKAEVEPPISVLVTGMKDGTQLTEESLRMKHGLKELTIVCERCPAVERGLSPAKAKLPRRSQRERKPKTFFDFQSDIFSKKIKRSTATISEVTKSPHDVPEKNAKEALKTGKPRPQTLNISQDCQKVIIYSPDICDFGLNKGFPERQILLRNDNTRGNIEEKNPEPTLARVTFEVVT